MKGRRSAKLTADSSSVSVTMPLSSSRQHAESNADRLINSSFNKCKLRYNVNMSTESPPLSVSSRRTQRSCGSVPAEIKVESRRTKKRRLEEVFRRVCVICTKVVEEVGSPEADYLSKQIKGLNQFARLLRSCQLNIFDFERWTFCETCSNRVDELISNIDCIKSLETQVNQLANDLYIDLDKRFTDEEREHDDNLDEVIYYRSQLFENSKTFAFEAKPVANLIFDVRYLPAAEENDGQPEDSIEYSILPLGDVELENDYTEDLQNHFYTHEFKADEHDIGNAVTEPNDETFVGLTNKPNSSPSEELGGGYLCRYVGSGDAVPCQLAFNDEKAFEMHTKAHTLHIPLGTAKNVMEQHGLKVYNEMVKQQETLSESQSLQCPLCGKAPFKLPPLKRHIKKLHKSQFHSCPNPEGSKKKRCSQLFSSKEDLLKHLQSCRMKPGNRSKEEQDPDESFREIKENIASGPVRLSRRKPRARLMDEDASTADEPEDEHNRDKQVYPQRVENSLMLCPLCRKEKRKEWTQTTYIKHVLTTHRYFVCNHKDTNNVTCLGALRSEKTMQNHLRENHDLDTTETTDLGKLYLDPRCHTTQCPTCGMKDLGNQAYVDHLREHGLLVCGTQYPSPEVEKRLCTRAFDRSRDLDTHSKFCGASSSSKDVLPKGKGSWCRLCKTHLKCKDRTEWLEHVKKHGGFACNIYDSEKRKFCQQLYMSAPLMKSHIETDHPTAVLNGDSPPVDNGGVNALDLLKGGQLDEVPGLPQDGRYECKMCPEVFEVYDQNWVDHVRSHGGMICGALDEATGKPCLTIFYYNDRLYTHCKKSHDRLIEGAYFCKACRRGCLSLEEYQKHQRLHGDKRGMMCEICGKESQASQHGLSCLCSKVCICEICGKDCKKPCHLKAHMAVDHEGHREICKICGKEFRRILNLRLHLFKQHGEGQGVECSVCKKVFLSAGILASHFKNRHGEKKFKCNHDGCTWGFTTSYALRFHIARVHEKLRPYVCDICGSTFKTKDHWATHLKKHEAGLKVKFVREVDRGIRRPVSEDQKMFDADVPYL